MKLENNVFKFLFVFCDLYLYLYELIYCYKEIIQKNFS